MSRVDALLADYASFHRTRGNVACHFVGIPLIVFGILAMLQAIPVAHVGAAPWTAAELLILLVTAYYLVLDVRLALAMLLVSLALDFVALRVADWRVGLAAFALGWIFQGVGHARYEKRSPAFLRNAVHLLVGPIFLLNEVLHVRHVAPVVVEAPREA